MFRYIDIHSHVNFAAYDEDREAVIARAKEAGVAMINVGTSKETSQGAVELAGQHDDMYAIIGLHPVHTAAQPADLDEVVNSNLHEAENFDYDWYKALALDPKVVGIGECGLDYFHADETIRKLQLPVFEQQIALANELDKPLMLHIRNAYGDALGALKREARVLGNVHFFFHR